MRRLVRMRVLVVLMDDCVRVLMKVEAVRRLQETPIAGDGDELGRELLRVESVRRTDRPSHHAQIGRSGPPAQERSLALNIWRRAPVRCDLPFYPSVSVHPGWAADTPISRKHSGNIR